MISSDLFEVARNLVATSAYLYFQGFPCWSRENVVKVSGTSAFFFITAVVFWLSSRDLTPEFMNIYPGMRTFYKTVAVITHCHILFCYFWVEALTLLSSFFCAMDSAAKSIGLGVLLNNKIVAVNCDGYLDLFSVLSFLLLTTSIYKWARKADVEYEDLPCGCCTGIKIKSRDCNSRAGCNCNEYCH